MHCPYGLVPSRTRRAHYVFFWTSNIFSWKSNKLKILVQTPRHFFWTSAKRFWHTDKLNIFLPRQAGEGWDCRSPRVIKERRSSSLRAIPRILLTKFIRVQTRIEPLREKHRPALLFLEGLDGRHFRDRVDGSKFPQMIILSFEGLSKKRSEKYHRNWKDETKNLNKCKTSIQNVS